MRLKRLILIREKAEPERTFGALHYGSRFVAFTLEPGDADTAAPRVPAGFYHCTTHGWESNAPVKYRETWALNGSICSAQPESGVPRAAILLHAGNRDDDTRGCIIVGLKRGEIHGEPGVLESKAAMDSVRKLIGHGQFYLTIMEG